MAESVWKIIFVLFWIAFSFIRSPHHIRRYKRTKNITLKRVSKEKLLVFFVFLGMIILPLTHIITRWLNYFGMNLLDWSRWIGAAFLTLSLILLWWVHETLGENWSPLLEIREEHTLITKGPYKYIRHPMYAFFWIWAVGQWLILSNWLVGITGLLPWALLYFVRVDAEERMMIKTFGEEYKNYMKITGRVFPRLGFFK